MGIEFIRNASGKPYPKRWARGFDRIRAPTLMDVSISEDKCGPPLTRDRAWLRPSSSASGSSERLRRSS